MANPTDHSDASLAGAGDSGDPPLPPGLWPRVARARRRQLRRRRAVMGGGLVAACLALALPLRLAGPGEALRAPGPSIAAIDAAPAATENATPATADQATRLRILDRELQDAYRRGSAQAEIAQLWQARDAVLRGSAPATPIRPVRI